MRMAAPGSKATRTGRQRWFPTPPPMGKRFPRADAGTTGNTGLLAEQSGGRPGEVEFAPQVWAVTNDTAVAGLQARFTDTRDDLFGLYHGRWGIEELYKTSKNTIAVEEFHGQTERGVRQELYAHFNLIAMTRLLSNRGDGLLEDLCKEDGKRQTTNFRNALAMMAANLEELVLARAAALARIVAWMEERILAVRSRLRPGRSYPRQSMQPRDKWSQRESAAA